MRNTMDYKKLYNHPLYAEDISRVSGLSLPWDDLKNSTVFISGATGMIGSMLIDVLMSVNESSALNCSCVAAGRSADKFDRRFEYWHAHREKTLFFCECDINEPLKEIVSSRKIDYIIHLASNTHPVAYSTDPVGTILTNIYGTKNLLDLCVKTKCRRFVFASSNEIYGENRGDTEFFDENYCGYINCNTLRAGYPESKRCGEALLQAYIKQFGIDAVIARFTRTYGPTLLSSDTKALSQFLKNALNGEDIVLKSDGTQFYSYTYAADAVAGLLSVLLKGKNAEAYNIADEKSDIQLKDLAAKIAGHVGKKVIFDLPGETEKAGFSKATKARLNADKLKKLGWELQYPVDEGIRRVLLMLSGCR